MNSTLSPPLPSSTNSSADTIECFTQASTLSLGLFAFFLLTNLLLSVFFVHVLYLCYQQRRRPAATCASAASCSNVFMYHYVTMQLLTFVGFTCHFSGGYVSVPAMRVQGGNVWAACALGQAMLNGLTCLEHYLAVVHPLVYVGLRRAGEIRVRNVGSGCVWLLSLGWLLVNDFLSSSMLYVVLYCCVMAAILVAICACSVSVLCALRRPGPGDVGGPRERADPAKRRSLQTITAILGVMLFKFGGNLTGMLTTALTPEDPRYGCLVVLTAYWIDLPSALVLPLLFLHRVGRLQRWRRRDGAAQRSL